MNSYEFFSVTEPVKVENVDLMGQDNVALTKQEKIGCYWHRALQRRAKVEFYPVKVDLSDFLS